MRRKQQVGLALIGALVLVATLAIGMVTAAAGRTFSIGLTSGAEVPTPNDVATGTAWLQINPGQNQVCFAITWDGVAGTVTASHIHEAPAGVAGPVVVPLFGTPQPSDANGDGAASACVSTGLTASELAEIVAHPEEYYVNVHSSQNPAGAVRGQLSD